MDTIKSIFKKVIIGFFSLVVLMIALAFLFGEEKTLLFIQALDNKEYKIDYSKVGTSNFIKIHQQTYI